MTQVRACLISVYNVGLMGMEGREVWPEQGEGRAGGRTHLPRENAL